MVWCIGVGIIRIVNHAVFVDKRFAVCVQRIQLIGAVNFIFAEFAFVRAVIQMFETELSKDGKPPVNFQQHARCNAKANADASGFLFRGIVKCIHSGDMRRQINIVSNFSEKADHHC